MKSFLKISKNIWLYKRNVVTLHLEMSKGYSGHAPMRDTNDADDNKHPHNVYI